MLRKLLVASASHHDNNMEDMEPPSLDISDTSTSAVEVSAREDTLSSSDEEGYRPRRKFTSFGDDDQQYHDGGVSEMPSTSKSFRRQWDQLTHRGEPVDADGIIDLSTRSDGRDFSFGRRSSRSFSPITRTAKPRRSKSSQARFSYSSRRSSLGGTTVYRTAYMASLDAYLNTTSALRLQTDGKCTFSFEKRRFIIQCAEPEDGGDGDYTIYLCIGPMKELKVKYQAKNLLKLITLWNEEMTQRCLRRQQRRRRSQDYDEDMLTSSGVLQIDSTKPGDANVAFIYYGHVNEIKNAAHFQTTLDNFVDDALYLFDRINHDQEPELVRHNNLNNHPQHRTRSLPSFHAENDCNRSKKLHMRDHLSRRQSALVVKSVSIVAEPTSTSSASALDESNSDVSATNNTDNENSSKSIFSRMISSWRSKAGEISFSPFIGLGNQEQDCYIIDKQAIEAGNVKPSIVLSRVGAGAIEKVESSSGFDERQLTVKTASHLRRRDCSRHRQGDDRRPDALVKRRSDRPRERRSITFDDEGNDSDYRSYAPSESARRRTYYGDDDDSYNRPSTKNTTSSRPHRRSTVYIADDFRDRHQPVHYRRHI